MNTNKILSAIFSALFFTTVNSQFSNNDFNKGPININLPKTPESAGFEKYGNIPVGELTGTPDISVPIYTLKSRFLEVPITLSYSPGIKVTQEASWVGLGFDLMTGGRITVETKGCIDEQAPSLFSNSGLKYGLQKLYNRLGSSSATSLLTFATTCRDCDTSWTHDLPDDWASVNAMAQYGVAQPDIFHANFMGYSFSYFFDILTDSLRFVGEKNLFNISFTRNNITNQITDWTVTDNAGNQYFFFQKELTTLTLPPLGPLQSNASTSAWLLTKILHPTGDSVVFTYSTYGNSYPSSDWNASMSFMETERTLTQSADNEQNSVILQSAYLSKIESEDIAIDFIHDNREDIKGTGSKRLKEIRIRDKLTNTVKKKASFGYGYFDASLSGTCYASQADSITKYYRLRLRLDSLTVHDSASLEPPYRFYYVDVVPHKKTFSMDHWGFYNVSSGTYTYPCSPQNLIPHTGIGTILNYSAFDGFSSSRECYPPYMLGMTMDSMVYPTGGSTKFNYEPHNSNIAVGGGLRIKSIKNYSLSRLSNSLTYTYDPGMYMGVINYNRVSYVISRCAGMTPGSQIKDNLSAWGIANDNSILVAYPKVTITQTNEFGDSNGYVVKFFNIPNPRYTTGGYGFQVLGSHWPVGDPYAGTGDITTLYPASSGFPPTPTMQLDGKLTEERYFDNSGNKLKTVNYFYHQADYSEKYTSIRAIDNRIGGPDASGGGCGGDGQEVGGGGSRRYTLFISPTKSFFTLTDSVVEKIFQGVNYLTRKKSYKYNSHYQVEYEISENSDGTQLITYTKTSAEIEPPHYAITPIGDAVLIKDLKTSHIYDLPIEQTLIRRTLTGDSLVTQSKVNVYQGPLAKKTYILETTTPLTLQTQFAPARYDYAGYPNSPSGSNYTLKLDSKYKISSIADYSSKGYMYGLQTRQGNSAFIWDEYYGDMLAQVENADSADIAFTSFESPATGRWTINPARINTDYASPSGKKYYSLVSGSNISISGLSNAKTYIVSYWSKNGAYGVNSTSPTPGVAIYGWTYYEHLVSNPISGAITISGTGAIDEVRLYPKGSLMSTYSYEPLVGLVSQSDVNNRIKYFEYDPIGRLSRIRDEQKFILKQFEYKFKDIFNFPYGNDPRSQTFTKNDCTTGYVGSQITYSVPAGKYGSFISVPDANRLADAEITAFDGQTRINTTGTCIPYYNFAICCGNGSSTNNFTLTGTGSVNFSFNMYASGGSLHGKVATLTGPLFLPASSKLVTIGSYQVTFYTNGDINVIGPSYSGTLVLSGTYSLN